MQINNVNAASVSGVKAEAAANFNPMMSVEEKARLELEVNAVNKETFGERRIPKQTLGQEEFIQLLTAQLKNQDPTAPMTDMEFIGQMAQFSSLEQMNTMNKNFSTLTDMLTGSSAVNVIGKKADLDLGGSNISGYISAAKRGANPEVMVNGNWYSWSAVKTIYAE